ncbi:NRDE family protein [Algoriphagus sp.]|uniref:NRDE family protein n=1 Tax=Algoriphagus sp. TaxID=1872435 RepID=UPI00391A1F7F
MCLVAFSWKNHSEYPLIISANRDEFFDRPTQSLHQWDSGIIAGKDLRGGGTWMGFHPDGKWALLTNYRDFNRPQRGEISRGKLVQNFLEGEEGPKQYLEGIFKNKNLYEGFNLLVSDGERLFYLSNYKDEIDEIQPGIYGLSNGLINEPWPKVELAKAQLSKVISEKISEEKLLNILKSTETHSIENLPKTGASEEMEIGLSAQLIRLPPNYGTVSASGVIVNRQGKTTITERTFNWDPTSFSDQQISI